MPTHKKEVAEHTLLHLQDIRRHLDTKNYSQVEFNIYEIAAHLGFSPKEVNKDDTSHH